MSIPRKHHYVPQVHIRKFKSEKGHYNLYLKKSEKILQQKSSASFFHVRDLNSTIDHNTGEVDHKTIETELGEQWDAKFSSNYQYLKNWIFESVEQGYLSTSPLNHVLLFFFEYAIIGRLRRLKQTEGFNASAFDWMEGMLDIIEYLDSDEINIDGLKEKDLKQVRGYFNDFRNKADVHVNQLTEALKYPVPTPTKANQFVPKSCSAHIFLAPQDCSFILPDTTGIFLKSNSTFDWHRLVVNEISHVGIPLSKDLFVQIINNDVIEGEKTDIYLLSPERTESLNNKLFDAAIDQVLASDITMLEKLLEHQG